MASWNLFPGTPQLATADDAAAVSLGTEFYTTAPAWVTHLRYLQPATAGSYSISTQPRTAGLYAVNPDGISGVLVAGPVTITAPAPGQWGSADLPAPYPLTTGTHYRAVVWHPDGRYAATSAYFAAADYTYGPVTVPGSADAVMNAQGSYGYGPALAFPISSYGSTAYYADATLTDTDPTPPNPDAAYVTVTAALDPRARAGTLAARTGTGTLDTRGWGARLE